MNFTLRKYINQAVWKTLSTFLKHSPTVEVFAVPVYPLVSLLRRPTRDVLAAMHRGHLQQTSHGTVREYTLK